MWHPNVPPRYTPVDGSPSEGLATPVEEGIAIVKVIAPLNAAARYSACPEVFLG